MTSQIVGWDDRWIFMEQHFLAGGKVCAKALFKTMIRSKDGLVTPQEVMSATGFQIERPDLSEDMKHLL